MPPEIIKDIRESTILNIYNQLLKITRFTNLYIKIIISIFLLGFISVVFEIPGEYVELTLVAVSAPAILLVFVMAVVHFLAGLKINSLCKKYKISNKELLDLM